MKESRLYDAQAEVIYQEHERRTAWINEHDWKIPGKPRRSLRTILAAAFVAMANRIAPPRPETDITAEAVTDSMGI